MHYSLENLAVLKISGPEAAAFLQGQITIDTAECPLKSKLGARCNIQGRVVFLFRLFAWQDNFYLLLPKSMALIAEESLKPYAAFSDCHIEIEYCDNTQLIGVSGNFDAALHLPEIENDTVFNEEGIIIRVPDTIPRFICFGVPRFIAALSDSFSHIPSGEAFETRDIKMGIPQIYPESSGAFLANRLNLPALHAIDFNKGCYLGQKIIARTHYRGSTKHQLQHLIADTDIDCKPMDEIHDENNNPIATIVNYSEKHLLAILPSNASEGRLHYKETLLRIPT